jgi:hypothetical protein
MKGWVKIWKREDKEVNSAPSLIFCRPEASAEGSLNSFYPLSISLISSSVRSYNL